LRQNSEILPFFDLFAAKMLVDAKRKKETLCQSQQSEQIEFWKIVLAVAKVMPTKGDFGTSL
jgi:hypothetical protein